MAIRKSGISGIPFGNTAARPASPSTGQPYFNGEVGRLELYTSNGWQNIVQETPGIASVSGTYNESVGSGTFTISGTNFVTGGIAYAVGTNGTEYQATTSTINSTVQMTALFTGLSPAYEPYDIKVLNPSNLFGLFPDAFYINDSPVWSTTAGSLGTWAGSNIQLSATDDESNTITYTVTSGSLPTGLSLSSAGLISGTNTGNPGTYTFTVSASDGINTAVTRSFSILVVPTVTGGTLTSDSTYYYRTFIGSGSLIVSNAALSSDILIVAGGGGSTWLGGGGGAGGIFSATNQSLSPATYSITVGSGGSAAPNSGTVGGNGVNSTFGSLTAAVGGGGATGQSVGFPNGPGGSAGGSGGGGARNNTSGGSSTQSSTGGTGYGNSGGNGTNSNSLGGGGGGGAGGSGGNADVNGGNGGIGTNAFSSWLTGISSAMTEVSGWSTATSGGRISGGGGGGSNNGNPGTGGSGGGGAGSVTSGSNHNGNPGISHTGGGAGGSDDSASSASNGGSGIVIVRYTKTSVGG
jgi:hypothetical protein